jgi:YegS/Rv2252/BmrU family lipid kinase
MRYLFIYNKKAGRKFQPSIVDEISNLLPQNVEYEFVEIQHLQHLKGKKKFDVFVAIGGDGTVNTVAQLANKHNKTLAIIPKGSGDGLARFLGISKNTKSALDVTTSGDTTKVDVAFLSNHFFINVAGTGFEAQVAHQFANGGIRGLLGYAKTIISTFKNHEEKEVKLTIDGKKKNIRYFSLAIANGSQWGNNFEIASQADIQDGLLDVAIMRKPRWYEILSLIAFLRTKKQKDNRLFTYYKASEIDIKKSGKVWHIDGEPILLKNKKVIRLVPQSLNIRVPL